MSVYLLPLEELLELELLEDPDEDDLEPLKRRPDFFDPLLPDELPEDELPEDDLLEELRMLENRTVKSHKRSTYKSCE